MGTVLFRSTTTYWEKKIHDIYKMELWLIQTNGNSNDSFHKDADLQHCWRIFISSFIRTIHHMGTGRGKETRICNTKDSTKIYYHYYSRRSFSVLILQMNQKKGTGLSLPGLKQCRAKLMILTEIWIYNIKALTKYREWCIFSISWAFR